MSQSESSANAGPITMYGPAIHGAVASGDLAQMKAVAQQAEEQLRQTGDVAAALEILKAEITRHEARLKQSG